MAKEVRIKLTSEQKAKIKEATGQTVGEIRVSSLGGNPAVATKAISAKSARAADVQNMRSARAVENARSARAADVQNMRSARAVESARSARAADVQNMRAARAVESARTAKSMNNMRAARKGVADDSV